MVRTRMGLDFGTTNSALALAQGDAVKVVNIGNQESAERTLPSVLFFNEDREVFVGQRAIDDYVSYGGGHGRFLQSLKAYLPQATFTETRIFGKRYELQDLLALILKEIKSIGEKYAGGSVDSVTLGRPVVFSENQENDALAEKRLREAAERAGFRDIVFEYESLAGTLAYAGQMETDAEELVMMGDFGGGTSDFSVMRLTQNTLSQADKKERVLAVGGVYVGGDTFDSRMMWEKVSTYLGKNVSYRTMTGQVLPIPHALPLAVCDWHKIAFMRDPATLRTIRELKRTANNPRALENLEIVILQNKGFMLFQAIERAKKELSTKNESRIYYRDSDLEIDEIITRAEFDAIIAEDVVRISRCVAETLAKAGVGAANIDRVLLTGGSSFVPCVRRLFETTFGKEKIVHLDAFTSVAHGLALSTTLR